MKKNEAEEIAYKFLNRVKLADLGLFFSILIYFLILA